MASWSPSPSPTPSPLQATAVSDCPQCGSVCVGGLLLPCGHLTCRKCLRDHHGSQLTCHTCQHRLPLPKDQGSGDFTSLVQQLGVDPVMALMVNERMRGQGRQACLSCENNVATTLCQDCNEFYCDSCARIHGRQRATRDHVMQPLPQALRNVSTADWAVPKPRTGSASSCDSMDIISNPMDQPTLRGPLRGSTRWKQWVRHEMGMLQAALSEQDALVTGLNDVLAVAEKRQTLLPCYARSLSLFDVTVTQQDDDDTFNVTVAHDDVSMQVKLDSLQQRLRDVIVGPQDASFTSDVRQLIKQLDDVLSMQGTWRISAQSSTTQSLGLLQSSTASSQVSVTSPSLSSFATPTVNMSTPTSSAATTTSTADGAAPTSIAATPASTAPKTTLNMSLSASSAATPTSTATKTTNTWVVTPATSTLVATTIISNSAAMPANTAATPTTVTTPTVNVTANTPSPISSVAPPTTTAVTSKTIAPVIFTTTPNTTTTPTNTKTTLKMITTFLSISNLGTSTNILDKNSATPSTTTAPPTNNAVTPTNTLDTKQKSTKIIIPPSNTAAPPTVNQATPTNTVDTTLKSTNTITPSYTTAPPVSQVTPTNTLDTTPKSIKSITYSNTTAPPTDKQATPTSTTVTNPSLSSTKDRATSDRTSITELGDTTNDKPTLANTTTTTNDKLTLANTITTTNDKPTLANTTTTTNDKPTLANTTTTTNDKLTLANTTTTNTVGATAAITTTPSPVCATTSTCTPSVDPMTARPRRAFSVRPVCDDDRNKASITSIISTRDSQRLVMTDSNNDRVKLVDLHPPFKVSASLNVIEGPWCLALLPDDPVAMTTYHPVIYLLKITDTVTVTSRIQTDVTYRGVGGLSDGRLIVSCGRGDNNGVARVNIITRDGNVVTTITDTNTLTRLDTPWYLCVVDSHVLLSDYISRAVYKVDIGSGHLVDTFTHPDLRYSHQLTSDESGNVYIASEDGQCVLVRSAGGQWRKLVGQSQHSDEGYDRPQGVCLTSDGRLVVTWTKSYCDSVVITYDLSSMLVAAIIINNSVAMSVHTATKPTTVSFIPSTPPPTTSSTVATPTAATVNAFTPISSAATPTNNAVTPTNTLDNKLKSTKHRNAPPTDSQARPSNTSVTNPSMPTNKDGATSTITKSGMASKLTKTTIRDGATSSSDRATPTRNTTTPSPICATTPTCMPSVDPMTACPRRAFSVRPVCDDDSREPSITSIISTRDGQRLVMTDWNNSKVKVVDLQPPHKVSAALKLNEKPHCLAFLPDDLVTITTKLSVIYLLEITDTITVTSRIQTDVTYKGVGGLSDGRLIVSCERDDNKGVARVDIITRDGNVVTTITDSNTLTRLDTPWYLCVVDRQVLLSDSGLFSHVVYKVDIGSGHLVDTFTHPDMSYPRQLTADGSGNVYIASEDGQCVLVRSAGGQWRKLVEASQHSNEGYNCPLGVCLTSNRLLVVAWRKVSSDSVVIAYDLSSMLVASTIINNSAVMPANAVSFTASARHPTTVLTVATPTAASVNALTTSSSAATPTNNAVTPTNNAVTPTNPLDTKLKSTKNIFMPFDRNAPPTNHQATSTSVTNHPLATNKDGATSTIPKSGMASRNTKTTTRDGEASTSDSATPIRNTTRTTKDGATATRNTASTTRVRAMAANTTNPSPACATTSTCTPSVDPMTARPRRAFSVRPVCDDDSRKPDITSIISTRDGQRLVMTDWINHKVKATALHPPYKVYAALTVIEKPWCLALLQDDLVVMTTYHTVIYLLKITDTVTVTSRIQTDVRYRGVGGLSDGLVVSCDRDDNKGVARVDIITRDGNVVTTITDTNTLTRLRTPRYLSVVDSYVLLSDYASHTVHKVDIGSGHLVDTFTHPDLRYPCQVTSDGSGNVYIASSVGRCVLVRSAGGQWRKLVEASQQSDEGYDCPRGVCLTSDGRLVVAWYTGLLFNNDSVVVAYDL